ncbi:MAG: hypothetical protein HY689_09560 [Chloroflexi bacterium]|nr:hypothetical protein [Chloroflexota bacterium]
MPSERVQRQIDRLLDEADEAVRQLNWLAVRDRAQAALGLDPDNSDARTYLAAAERALGESAPAAPAPVRTPTPEPAPAQPTSFADGRYVVKRFLGEGGKKKVFLARDARLDRDVAFALIKTQGLDDEGIARIRREAQAMGAWGTIPTSWRSTTSARRAASPSS